MKKAILTSILGLLVFVTMQAQYNEVRTEAEQMPYFSDCKMWQENTVEKRDCSNKNLINFISANLQYPLEAKEEGLEGTVYVSFVVNEFGNITEPNLLHDIGGNCGEEALRVVNLLPNFEPAIHEGKPAKVKLTLPIRFALNSQEKGDKFYITWGGLTGAEVTKEELRDNFSNTVQVRDREGNTVFIDELVFSFQRGEKIINAKSRGEVSKELEKIVGRVKKGGTFAIAATVQEGAEFIYVDRVFVVK